MSREDQNWNNDQKLFAVLKTLALLVAFLLMSHCINNQHENTYRSIRLVKHRVLKADIVDTKTRQEVKYIANKYELILDSISTMEKKNKEIYDRYVYDKNNMVKDLKEFHDAMDGLEQGAAAEDMEQMEADDPNFNAFDSGYDWDIIMDAYNDGYIKNNPWKDQDGDDD